MQLKVYDDPSYADRYTVVLYDGEEPYEFISMNSNPLSLTEGICRSGELLNDWLEENAENEIPFNHLPEPCRILIGLEFLPLSDSLH